MLEFVNEAVIVETQLRADGMARPSAFAWQGRRFVIVSWGRESAATQDGRTCHCYLVQTAGPESWELCQDTDTGGWTLTRRWARCARTV